MKFFINDPYPCMYLRYFFLFCLSFFRPVSSYPHIVLVVADDLGWHDVSFHGSVIETPHLNELSSRGIILNNYFVQPICTPSRSQLLFGRYQIHTGLQHEIIWAPQPNGVPLTDTSLASFLKSQTYRTHMVGKWHLGFYKKEYTPLYRGFDTFYGYLTGSEDYYNHTRCSNMPGQTSYCGYDFWENERPLRNVSGQYSTHLFSREAVDIITEHNPKEPLFLYLAFQSVHAPLQVPKKYVQRYKHIKDPKRRKYAGMVTCMDEAIGNVTESLKASGMWNNTVFIFTTDNGGQVHEGGNNWPLRGYKFTWWDGGLRGVGLVSSPLLKRHGIIDNNFMHISDWYPTVLSLAGVSNPNGFDGFNMWPTLNSGAPSPRQELLVNIDPMNVTAHMTPYPHHHFDTRVQAVIRTNRWKLITGDPGDGSWIPPPEQEHFPHTLWHLQQPELKSLHTGEDVVFHMKAPETRESDVMPSSSSDSSTLVGNVNSVQLYDMSTDITEQHNVAYKYPDVVRLLLDRLVYYNQTAAPCRFPAADPLSNPALHGGVWQPWL